MPVVLLPAGFSSSYMDGGLRHCNELVFPSISEERERERERGGGRKGEREGGGRKRRLGDKNNVLSIGISVIIHSNVARLSPTPLPRPFSLM